MVLDEELETRSAIHIAEQYRKQKRDQEKEKQQTAIDIVLSTPSLARTVTLIRDYINETHRKCFTYNSIKSFASRVGFYREFTDRTLDRCVRKLAELGILYRFRAGYGGRLVLFCPTRVFYLVLGRLVSGSCS